MANNDNAKLNVNIEGSENIVNSLNAIVASFSNFSRNLTSLANKVTKFNRDAAAIATGLKALKDASSGGKITRDQSRNPVNAILSLDTLKQTFATYKKYLKAEMRESIEILLSQKSYGGSAKENNALIALIKNSAKAKKEYLRESRNFGAIVEKTESHFATIRKREEREIKKLEEAIKAGLGRIAALRQKQAMSTNRAITGGGRDKVFDRMSNYYKSQDADLKASMQIANKLIAWKEKENEKLQRLRNADLANSMKIGKEMLKWKEREVEKTRTLNEKVNASRIKRSVEAITQKDPELISMAAFYKEQEKEAKKIQKLKESLMKQSSIDNSARIKKAVSSITEKDPELTAMAAFYREQEKEAKKIQKLKETYDKNVTTSRVKKAVSAITEKDPELLAMRKFYKEQAREADRIAKLKEKDDLKRISSSSRSAEINLRKEQRAANEIRKKKEAELKRQSALSIRSQIVDRFKKMDAQPGKELDYTITGLSNFKEAASNTIDTVTNRMKVFGMVGAGIIAGFVGIGVAIKNWGYEVILTTEKLRGYNIALLGSMKTQKDVNNLLKASEEITKDLPVGYEQMIQATKALSMIAPLKPLLRDSEKSKKVLGDVWNIVLGLSQIEPEWGISGAIFSLREALSGDLLSLKRRFEIPVDFVTTNEGKKISEVKNMPEKMLEGLSNFMSQSFGKEALEMTAKQFGAVLNKIESLYTKFKGAIGESGIYDYVVSDLQKVLDYFSTFSESSEFQSLTKNISNSLIAMYENVKNGAIGTAKTLARIFGHSTNEVKGQFDGIVDVLQVFNYYIKWAADYVSSDAFQNWAVEMSKYSIKAIRYLVDTGMALFNEMTTYFNKNIKWVYDTFMWLINQVKSLVGDKGLLAIAIIGPKNSLALIKSSFEIVNGLVVTTSTLAAQLLKSFLGLAGAAGSWAVALGGVAVAMYGIYKLTKANFDAWLKNRNIWQKMGIGLTPEMKAQDKVEAFDKNLATVNLNLPEKFKLTSEDFFRGTATTKLNEYFSTLKSMASKEERTKNFIDSLGVPTKEEFELAKKAYDLDEKALKVAEDQHSLLAKIKEAADKSTNMLIGIGKVGIGGVANLTGFNLETLRASNRSANIENIEEVTKNAGVLLETKFKELLGTTLGVSEGFAMTGHAKGSAHYVGEALDFSGQKITADVARKLQSKEVLVELAKAAIAAGVTDLRFENAPNDLLFNMNELKKTVAEVNQELGTSVLSANYNDKAKGAHIHMSTREGKADSGAMASVLPPMPPSFSGAKPVGSSADQVPYQIQYTKAIAAIKEYAEYLKAFGENIGAVRKAISTGNEYAKNLLTDITTTLNKDGDAAKVGYEQVTILESALANLKSEKKNFPKVFDLIQKNVETALSIIPDATSLGDSALGKNAMSVVSTLTSSAISSGLKNINLGGVSLIDYVMETLQGSIDQAEKEVPKEAEKTKRIMQSLVREQASKSDSKFFRVIPDIQERVLLDIVESYNQTLPAQIGDVNDAIKGKVFTKLQQITLDIRSGLSMDEALDKVADEVSSAMARSVANSFIKTAMGNPAGSIDGGIFNATMAAIQDNQMIETFSKFTDTLASTAKSAKAAKIALDEKNASIQKEISASKTMSELMQYRGKGNRATRSAFYGQYQTLLETEPQGNAFQMGIESSLSNFKNWSEQMFEIGSQLVTDLSGVFETNFFDTLTGKFKNFADMFKSLGNAIRDMIVKIIAKMAAISLTKIVLDFDISGGISGGGGGGFGGILNSVVGGIFRGGGGLFGGTGGGSAATGISGMALQAASGSMGMGGFNLGSVLQGGIGAAAAKAGGMKLLGSGGALSKAWGRLKAFNAANPWVLPAAAAGMFLTQPGRLFGGTKDKTAGAQEQYAAASSSRDAMIKRRAEDAANYYGSGNAANISGFNFGAIGYSTWTSGDGWFRGPKEKHAATDASAFNASMVQYYDLLRNSASDHAMKMRQIDKLREINEVSALNEEKSLKQKYLDMLTVDYNVARTANDFAKMDELRDKVQEAQMEVYRLSDDIVRAQIEMAKNIKEALKTASENFVSVVTGLKGTNYTSGNVEQLSSFYKMQQQIIQGSYISKENMAAFGADPNLIQGLQAQKKYSGSLFNRKSTTIGYNYGKEGKAELLAALDEYVNNYLKQLRISNTQAMTKTNISDIANNLNNTFVSPFIDLYKGMKDTKKMMDTLRGIPAAAEEYYQLQLEYSDYQEKVSEQIKAWMNSGLINKDPSYWTTLINGPLDKLQAALEAVSLSVRLKNFKTGIFDTIKGFESNKDFTDVVNMVKDAGGDASLYSGMTTGADPWESWYNWSLTMIQTKISNAQKGSEEYFTAQEELFRLMAEKAERQKQNAEDAYAKIEEALEKIGETMKVRVAEESKTTKGDTYFIDVGASRDATKQLEAMLAKINTNDPKARELIEAFRKRIMGIRS